jgi:hypothetical protein
MTILILVVDECKVTTATRGSRLGSGVDDDGESI